MKSITGCVELKTFYARLLTMEKMYQTRELELVHVQFLTQKSYYKRDLGFLRGETDTRILETKGVNFWKGNTTREFLDARGLGYLNEGDIGAAYSQQWRNFGGYDELNARDTGSGRPPSIGGDEGVDQLKRLIDGLRDDIYGRRHIVTLWNPLEEHLMPLTPCHHTMQVVVLPNRLGGNTLSLKLINRSLDTAFGCVFALYQYRM